MSGGVHAHNKTHPYKRSSMRMLQRKAKRRATEKSSTTVAPAIIRSNVELSKKKLKKINHNGKKKLTIRNVAKVKEAALEAKAASGDVDMCEAQSRAVRRAAEHAAKTQSKKAAKAAATDAMDLS